MSEEINLESILADRGAKYGKFSDHAAITQQIKDIYRNHPGWQKLTPNMRESLEMNAHKVGRILNGDPTLADSWDDIAGYSKLVGDKLRGKDI